MATLPRSVEIRRPVVWVNGASRGIGKEIAKQFAQIGCEVCLSSRSLKHVSRVSKEIIELGGRAHPFKCDSSRLQEISSTVKRIEKKFGRIDVLVNNAGLTVFKSFLETTVDETNAILDTNLRGPMLCIKSVLPGMVKRKSGWIINILSFAALKTFEKSGVYTATKAGMLGFGKVLREETRLHNIKVVTVMPGATDTEMWNKQFRKKHSHRMMTPQSVAETVLALYQLPDDVVVDEIALRPMMGDID